MFKRWTENLYSFPNLLWANSSQVIWYIKCVKVDNKSIYHFKM